MTMRARFIQRDVLLAGCLVLASCGATALAQQPAAQPASAQPTAPATGKPSQLFRPQPQQKIELPTLFDPAKPIEPTLQSAHRRAAVDGQRVLVVLGTDGAGFTMALRDLVATPDIARLLATEFAIAWAYAGEDQTGPANRAWAERAEIAAGTTPTAAHAMLVILDLDGKKVASMSMQQMIDETRPRAYSTIMLQDFLLRHAAPPPSAKDKLDAALASAKSAGKGVLLSFVDTGNPWSMRWRDMLRQEEMAKDLAEVCEVVTVNLIRDKEAATVLDAVAGQNVQSVPWYAMLDAQGKVLAASQPPGGKGQNIGMPTSDKEIAQVLELFASGPKKPDAAWTDRVRGVLVRDRELRAK